MIFARIFMSILSYLKGKSFVAPPFFTFPLYPLLLLLFTKMPSNGPIGKFELLLSLGPTYI